METIDKSFDKWLKWIERIQADLSRSIDKKQIYGYFIEVVNANLEHIKKNNGVLFCDFIRECYAVQAAMSIRRHIKTKGDDVSLGRLLDQLKNSANQFTYDFYLTRYPINGFEWQKPTFKNFSKNGAIISKDIIDADIKKLNRIGSKVSDFVDRVLAHLDKRGYSEKITYGDLDKTIDSFNEIACKYISLIVGKGYCSLQATIQFDWKDIFAVPLDIRKFN